MTSEDPTGKHGVALIVTPEVANRMEDFESIKNRMAHMTVNFGREKDIFIILYARKTRKNGRRKRRNSLEMYRQRLITSKETKT